MEGNWFETIFRRYDVVRETQNEMPWNDVNFTRKVKKCQWVVTEKIHGSNFSFYFNGNDWKVAKRNSLLSNDEIKTFFGCHEVLPRFLPKLPQLFQIISNIFDDVLSIVIYGELCGGNADYPNAKIGQSPKTPVQVGILYSPQIEFIPFDIDVVCGNISNPQRIPLRYDWFLNTMKECNIIHVPLIKIGSIQEALEIDLTFDSHLPKLLGLEPPPQGSNQAEGIVIKPYPELIHGSKTCRESFKRKHPKFKEIEDFELPRIQSDYLMAEANLLIRATLNRVAGYFSKNGVDCNIETAVEEILEDILLSCASHSVMTYNWWCNQGGCGFSPEGKQIKERVTFKIQSLIQKYFETRKESNKDSTETN
ncbi:RNA ligase domain-containing protein [Entamoeba marina]